MKKIFEGCKIENGIYWHEREYGIEPSLYTLFFLEFTQRPRYGFLIDKRNDKVIPYSKELQTVLRQKKIMLFRNDKNNFYYSDMNDLINHKEMFKDNWKYIIRCLWWINEKRIIG